MRDWSSDVCSSDLLSATIRKLEKELNVELFERKGRNIRLSASGKIFYKYISQAQALFDTAVTEAQRSRQSQTLLIFVENTHIWAGAFLDFKNKFTNIQLNITPLVDFGQLIEPFDFYLGNVYNVTDNKFKYHILFKPEKYYVLMSSGHRLAKRESVSLNDLKDETFFSITRRLTHVNISIHSRFSKTMESISLRFLRAMKYYATI